ncbi:hypothetical protein AB2L27_19010 [Kineococcus sp. LSe6-4]|uniref:Uncharacterized protein n=1 Tax=Kineococcus halophytocola TaxID=3234027 RepID=A0ABV4H6X0_9ACTN
MRELLAAEPHVDRFTLIRLAVQRVEQLRPHDDERARTATRPGHLGGRPRAEPASTELDVLSAHIEYAPAFPGRWHGEDLRVDGGAVEEPHHHQGVALILALRTPRGDAPR